MCEGDGADSPTRARQRRAKRLAQNFVNLSADTVQDSSRKSGIVDDCACKIRACKVGVFEIGMDEIGVHEACVAEVGAGKIGVCEVGIGKNSAFQKGIAKERAAEIDVAKILPFGVAAAPRGIRQAEFLQVGMQVEMQHIKDGLLAFGGGILLDLGVDAVDGAAGNEDAPLSAAAASSQKKLMRFDDVVEGIASDSGLILRQELHSLAIDLRNIAPALVG
jgi:hypothetical protein